MHGDQDSDSIGNIEVISDDMSNSKDKNNNRVMLLAILVL